ncbi:hypothetical protein KGQ34_03835 [Patescibacteria group bacterium]|nr:hypothetical protein [Patescibacteria group bacterium]
MLIAVLLTFAITNPTWAFIKPQLWDSYKYPDTGAQEPKSKCGKPANEYRKEAIKDVKMYLYLIKKEPSYKWPQNFLYNAIEGERLYRYCSQLEQNK